jgi:hypothetical protein
MKTETCKLEAASEDDKLKSVWLGAAFSHVILLLQGLMHCMPHGFKDKTLCGFTSKFFNTQLLLLLMLFEK